MSAIAFLRELLDAGLDLDAAMIAAEKFERKALEAIEARKAKDRERKRVPRNSAESTESTEVLETAETPPKVRPLPPQTPLTPTPTPPETTTRVRTSARRPAKRCPEDWEPKSSTLAKLAEEGFVAGDLERALTKMRDHEFKSARTDWDATFRNWLRDDRDRRPRPANDRPHHDPKFEARQANHARALAGADSAARQRWEP